MLRRNKTQDRFIIAACNFTPVPRDGFRIGVPEAGRYEIVLNTDSSEYWGSDYSVGAEVFHSEAIDAHGKNNSIMLNLPPLATVFIKKVAE